MWRVIRAQSDFRQTQLRNALTSLVLYESITTTKAKAMQLLPFANHFFNRVRPSGLNEKRLAHSTLLDKNAIVKVFEEILPRYSKGETTFVRGIKVAPRAGDAAPQMAVTLIVPLKTAVAKDEEKTSNEKKVTTKKKANGNK